MLEFRRYRAQHRPGELPGTHLRARVAYQVIDFSTPGSVNSRSHALWRPDNRYAGHLDVHRDSGSEGVALHFDALRHGGKEPRLLEIVHPGHVDKLILSLLQIRGGDWIK